jgi:hypothetical protein
MDSKIEKMEKMEPKAEKAPMQPMAQPMMKAKAPAPMGYSGNYDGGKSNGGSCYDHGRKSSQ